MKMYVYVLTDCTFAFKIDLPDHKSQPATAHKPRLQFHFSKYCLN
jgi:hypothetical protein